MITGSHLGRRLFVVVSVLRAAVAHAQLPERIDSGVNARIRDEGTRRSQVLATASTLSDGFGPRLSGSPGYSAAARWAVTTLTRFGATRSTLEPWGTRGPAWEVTQQSAEMTAPYYLRLNAVPLAWSRPTRGTITGKPVIVPSLASAPERAAWTGKLRGKIVLLGRVSASADLATRFSAGASHYTDRELDSMARITVPGSPATYWEDMEEWFETLNARQTLLAWMTREGVRAIVHPSTNELALHVTEYNSAVSRRDLNVPAFVVAREQYRRMQLLVDHGSPVTLRLAVAVRENRADTIGVNVIAEIAGSDPALTDEVVMMGGHLDSWHAASGATDNAAGSAVAMEALRILVATGARPRRTIRLALWDGEEQEDYLGSVGYVRRHFGNLETMQLRNEHRLISAYFNVDHGTGRIRGWFLQGNAAAGSILSAYLAPWNDLGAMMVSVRNRGSTDHIAFTGVGIPGFNSIQDPMDYEPRTHHTSLDGAGFLVEPDLQQAAMVLASTVYHVASRDALMPRTALPAPRRRQER